MGKKKKRLKWFKLYKQKIIKIIKIIEHVKGRKEKTRILAGIIQEHPPVCATIRMYWSNRVHPSDIQQAKTRSTTLDFVSFAPLDQTLVVVHEDFRLGNDPPFDPE